MTSFETLAFDLSRLAAFQRVGAIKRGASHYRAKLTETKALEIHRLKALPFCDSELLAALYGVDASTIRSVWCGKSWGWLHGACDGARGRRGDDVQTPGLPPSGGARQSMGAVRGSQRDAVSHAGDAR